MAAGEAQLQSALRSEQQPGNAGGISEPSALRSGPDPLAEARRPLERVRGLYLLQEITDEIDRWLAEHPEENPDVL